MTEPPSGAVADLTVTTADGESLQAESFRPDDPVAAVVIAHPHPLMGGDMYTPVPSALFRALPSLGAAGIRFNFRGVGRSTGSHDKGVAEQLDVAAALDAVADLAPGVPLILSGWSFGADTSLALDDARIAGWFLAAAVLRVVDPDEMGARMHPAPKRFVIGSVDEFAAPDVIHPRLDGWTNTSTIVLDGADHFFGAHLSALTDDFRAFVAAVIDGSA